MKTRTPLLLPILLGTLGLLQVEADEPRLLSKPEASTRQIVRIFPIKSILGSLPEEGDKAGKEARNGRWDSLMSLFDTALIMAGCEEPRPTFGLHDQANCLAVGGTPEQIELVSQAISACQENEQPRSPILAAASPLHAAEPKGAQDLPQQGAMPRPGLPVIAHDDEVAKQTGPEASLQVRSYALGFFSQGYNADEGRRLQRTAVDLITLALKANHTPATHEDSLSIHGDTSVLIARATDAQHAIIANIIGVLKENTPDRPAADIAPTPAKSVVRIFALGQIFGAAESDSEAHNEDRATKTQALISQIRTSMAMARLSATMPELSFHGSSNSLIAKGTPAQMDLITQAITAWRENTPDYRPIRGQ